MTATLSAGPGRGARFADAAGVLGAAFAALCCAGVPIVVGVVGALGLGFLRRDAILWPLMLASLAVAVWGFWRGARLHGAAGPLWLGSAGAAALSAGVIFVHGPPAMALIWGGVVALLAATAWNAVARRACIRRAAASQPGG